MSGKNQHQRKAASNYSSSKKNIEITITDNKHFLTNNMISLPEDTKTCSFSNSDILVSRTVLAFKNLLVKSDIPYLYLGSNFSTIKPFNHTESPQTDFSPADFLVNLKETGKILFNIKEEPKIRFEVSTIEHFFISVSEIESLKKVEKTSSTPICLSYCKKKHQQTNTSTFYLIYLSEIVKFMSQLYYYYDNPQNFNQIQIIRIPNELLIKVDTEIPFKIEVPMINHKLLKDYHKLNSRHNQKISNEILKYQNMDENYSKLKLTQSISRTRLFHCLEDEIHYHLHQIS